MLLAAETADIIAEAMAFVVSVASAGYVAVTCEVAIAAGKTIAVPLKQLQ
jgi:hypothetical protein